MKKFFAIILMLAVLCSGFAMAESTPDSTIKVLEITYSNIMNVPFEGGYIGFCITHDQPGASEGDPYDVAGTAGRIMNGTEDVSNIVKALLVECVDDFMIEQADGVYKIRSVNARENLYSAIRWITGGYNEQNSTMSATVEEYIDRAKARAEAETISDIHVETFSYGPISYNVTFDFRVFLTRNPSTEYMQGQQNYFGFKVTSAVASANSTPLPTITPAPIPPSGGNEGGNEPGGNEPGGNEPGGNEPGGNEPGGNEPGGNEPGGNEPGGNEPGGNEPGGNVGGNEGGNEGGNTGGNEGGNSGSGEPGTAEPTPDPGANAPQTGDGAHIGLWLALLAVSGAALLLLKRKSA